VALGLWILYRLRRNRIEVAQRINNLYHLLRGVIISESQDAVDAVVAQLVKVRDEVVAEVANLEAQVAAGQAPDLTALKEIAQSLDDLNPDPAPEPAPEV
jgi:hypothetical protein